MMKIKRKRRLYGMLVIVLGVGIAIGLSLYALGQDVDLYLTPTQALAHRFSKNQEFRLGGMVVKNSFYRQPGTMHVRFVLTDYHHSVKIDYTGVLPTLFRTGQGIVLQGRLNSQGVFVANQVLAKHDANYMPPGIQK